MRLFKLFTIAAASALLLAACAPMGASERASLGRPLTKDYLQIVSASDELVEVDSAGRLVRAKAPDGLCIPSESIQTSRAAVFLIMGDCLFNQGPTASDLDSDENGVFGGVLSVSIANGPMDAGATELASFLKSGRGLAELGFGGGAPDVVLKRVEDEAGTLYVLVEDKSGSGPAFAGDTICRAFTELNGRLTVVTLYGLRSDPRSPDEMRARLGEIIRMLKKANAASI